MGKRVLSEGQRVTIRELHKQKHLTVTALSTIYGVSRATIRFVLHPHLEEENRKRSKLRMRERRNESNATEN